MARKLSMEDNQTCSAYYPLEEFVKPAIKESEEAKAQAQDAIAWLEAEEKRLKKLADEALDKYPLL